MWFMFLFCFVLFDYCERHGEEGMTGIPIEASIRGRRAVRNIGSAAMVFIDSIVGGGPVS